MKPHFSVNALNVYIENSKQKLAILNECIDECIAKDTNGYHPNASLLASHFTLDALGSK